VTVLEVTEIIGLTYKHRFNRPRPNLIEVRLRPALPVPSHAAYPSNHSFQSFSVANIIQRIVPEHPGVAALFHRARRVAENREWAGLHYPSDTEAGQALAARVTPYLVEALDSAMREAQREW
jgi:membrane-associated phospholipid phosphatase